MDFSGKRDKEKYILTLYVANMSARTRFAIENIRKICREHLEGSYKLEVIDIREDPSVAFKEKIVATPLLIKHLPLPIRTFIGNMQDINKILVGLELKRKKGAEEKRTQEET